MASSLIDDLLLDAADASVSGATLLRKALVVAAKLGVDEVPQWINRELSGYYGIEEIPSYRIVRGRLKAKIMHRFIDAQFDSNEVEQKISERRIDGSVSDLEALLSSEGALTITYPVQRSGSFCGKFLASRMPSFSPLLSAPASPRFWTKSEMKSCSGRLLDG